ncbi:MAG: hypothetical protein HRT47_02265 [Candidatus Caenarcaniphilales bacterium]|nr:hypothetical protein [Candidatus Caenarcaniphilales bacterium]
MYTINQEDTLDKSLEIKYSYRKAKNTEADFETFKSIVSDLENSNLKDAYMAAQVMLSSKFKKNPFSKIQNFKKGRKKLEKLFLEYSNSLELRYIRLAVQLNTPALLSYRDNIKEDRDFILNEIKTSKVLASEVKLYLLDFLRRYELIDS